MVVDWADEQAQIIWYRLDAADAIEDERNILAAALRAAKEEQLEADCAECCAMCAEGRPVRAVYGRKFWHGNEEGEQCHAHNIRAAAARKGME